MEKPRFYIHIGTHKTGSTAIQQLLNKNKYLLRENGYVYLRDLEEKFQTLKMSTKIDTDVITLFKKELANSCKRNKSNIPDHRFIISSEGFSGNPLIGYKNAGIVAEHLYQITDDFDVYVIVYLRRQDDFIGTNSTSIDKKLSMLIT